VSPTQGVESGVPPAAIAMETKAVAATPSSLPGRPRLPLLTLPVVTGASLALHHFVLAKGEAPADAQTYSVFLGILLGAFVLLAGATLVSRRVRAWMEELGPILAVALALLTLWEVVTAGLHLLPMPYFPAPAGIVQSLVNDRDLLFDSTWHSLVLLLSGYGLGVATGLITGICIGWSVRVRYWGMPVLKVLGPIPATAWIPFAMVVSPNSTMAASGLIGLAVWFPVSMLTASGVANTRASYLDVARTLGAGRPYLVFRVAIPAAMPNIFVGLFMGLGAAFLTLVVAETVGVRSGLGWYVAWAQGWAEYGKVFAALVIMSVFFSTIMSLLFVVRDRVLVWQKGMIRW
jgi:NitT/TauT family transport system permease protein